MSKYIIAYDLGTGGNKASLYDVEGNPLAGSFVPYETQYPHSRWHEQRPDDWWDAVVQSTRDLLAETDVDAAQIECIGISGHSLGAVPLDAEGALLRDGTPIWSDSRPESQVTEFFSRVDEAEWYTTTGNGFPAALYTAFKIMWYRDNEPDMFAKIAAVIGTKDYVNYKLTGRIVTDYSYASGSGVYDLLGWDYSDKLLAAANLPREIFPDILPSTEVIGELTAEAAAALGLPPSVKVVAGGVDNSCMALGARNTAPGRVYNSQGSSSWIAISDDKPLLDVEARPYVFTHVIPGMFTSAVGVFSTGTSFRWVRDHLCRDLVRQAQDTGADVYDLMTAQAGRSPVGAGKLLFNPSMAGGSSLDESTNIRGAFIGLDLAHTQADVIRATMEGVAMALRVGLDALRKLTQISDEIVVVGGGSRSELWRQIHADLFRMNVVKTNIDQQAAALGAAALGAVGTGLWSDFARIDEIHQVQSVAAPIVANSDAYDKLMTVFRKGAHCSAQLGNMLAEISL